MYKKIAPRTLKLLGLSPKLQRWITTDGVVLTLKQKETLKIARRQSKKSPKNITKNQKQSFTKILNNYNKKKVLNQPQNNYKLKTVTEITVLLNNHPELSSLSSGSLIRFIESQKLINKNKKFLKDERYQKFIELLIQKAINKQSGLKPFEMPASTKHKNKNPIVVYSYLSFEDYSFINDMLEDYNYNDKEFTSVYGSDPA